MPEYYDLRKKVELYLITALIIISLMYAGFRAYPLITGPEIMIYNPHDGDIVASTTFELSGKVNRVKEITVQGRLIPIGTDGHFTEILVADAPYTILTVTATDFYGATVTKTIRVIPK